MGDPLKAVYKQIFTGSRLASRFAELGRDDVLRHSLLRGREHLVVLRGSINNRIWTLVVRQADNAFSPTCPAGLEWLSFQQLNFF
jgi:hypothetical protein